MALKSTPWSYRNGNSPLHRLPAGVKLVFLLFLSLAAFFPNLYILSGIAIVLVALSFVAGTGPAALLRGSGPLLCTVLAVFVINGVEFSPPRINTEGLGEALVFCARIGTAFAAGSLLFAVTTTGGIRKSLTRAEAFFRLEKLKPGLSIALMLGFMKSFFEIWEDLGLAWQSRGGRNTVSRLFTLVPLAAGKMMQKAAETAGAMESRGALL